MIDRPTHLVANPGDSRSLCGVRDPLPRVWAPFAPAHIRGHGIIICPDCYRHLPYA